MNRRAFIQCLGRLGLGLAPITAAVTKLLAAAVPHDHGYSNCSDLVQSDYHLAIGQVVVQEPSGKVSPWLVQSLTQVPYGLVELQLGQNQYVVKLVSLAELQLGQNNQHVVKLVPATKGGRNLIIEEGGQR